jgi:hypothetical protein
MTIFFIDAYRLASEFNRFNYKLYHKFIISLEVVLIDMLEFLAQKYSMSADINNNKNSVI